MASASGTWTHDHKKLAEDATVDLTGKAGFEVHGVGNYTCEVHVEATLTESHDGTIIKTGKGHVNKYEITTKTCVGTGAFTGCVTKGDTVVGLPWELTAKKTDVEIITEAEVIYQFEKCFIAEVSTAFPKVTLIPDNALTMSSFTISGEVKEGGTAIGSLTLGGTAAKTYGVHEPA